MPRLVLTPDEWARMSWHARRRAVNRRLRDARNSAPASVTHAGEVIAWAEGEREWARQALASLPRDPFASAHRRILLEAIREGRA